MLKIFYCTFAMLLITSCCSPKTESGVKNEFWINVDYMDEVEYCKNMGFSSYGEKEIEKYFKQIKDLGVTGVQWRVSATGHVMYKSKTATVFPGNNDLSKYRPGIQRMASILQEIDPLEIAVREARKNDIKIYIWMTLSDEKGTSKDIENAMVPEILIKHPEYALLDKEGRPMLGTVCYNVPEVRKYKLDIIRELVEYKADGIYLCTRTHCFYYNKDKDIQYGYNKEIVDEYKKRYGKNILKEDFDVNKWLEIRAEGLDTFMKDAAGIIHSAGQKVRLGIKTTQDENRGWPYGKAIMHWKSWVKNKWTDEILVGQYINTPATIKANMNAFKNLNAPDLKIYFWIQLFDYSKKSLIPLIQIEPQIKAISDAGGNGAVFHESVNLEENVKTFFDPIAWAYRKLNSAN